MFVVKASRNYVRTQSQKKMLIQKAMTLEDDIANQNSSNKYYKRSAGKYNGYFKIIYSPKMGRSHFVSAVFYNSLDVVACHSHTCFHLPSTHLLLLAIHTLVVACHLLTSEKTE